MKTLKTIKRIELDAIALGETIKNEVEIWQAIWHAELEERHRMGLHGKEAIEHYNKWMKKYNMEHFIVKED